jgi:hypothetical protein
MGWKIFKDKLDTPWTSPYLRPPGRGEIETDGRRVSFHCGRGYGSTPRPPTPARSSFLPHPPPFTLHTSIGVGVLVRSMYVQAKRRRAGDLEPVHCMQARATRASRRERNRRASDVISVLFGFGIHRRERESEWQRGTDVFASLPNLRCRMIIDNGCV